ncbi:MAG: FtsB family cell division protein [Nocardioidaceae bacterium]
MTAAAPSEGSGSSKARLTSRFAVLALVVAVLAVSYASSVRAWLEQRGEINALHAEISDRQASVTELEQLRSRWHDPAYIKDQARSRFMWLMPGETGYRVIGTDGEVVTDGGDALSEPVASNEAGESQWWDQAWGSVLAADEDPAAGEAAAARRHHQPATSIGAPPGGRRHR